VVQERPPPILKTLMVGPLGGDAGGLGAPTTYLEDVNGLPLGGVDRVPRAPTTYPKNIDGKPPGRCCWRFRSTHHLS
jgi:hypothetical protein